MKVLNYVLTLNLIFMIFSGFLFFIMLNDLSFNWFSSSHVLVSHNAVRFIIYYLVDRPDNDSKGNRNVHKVFSTP